MTPEPRRRKSEIVASWCPIHQHYKACYCVVRVLIVEFADA